MQTPNDFLEKEISRVLHILEKHCERFGVCDEDSDKEKEREAVYANGKNAKD